MALKFISWKALQAAGTKGTGPDLDTLAQNYTTTSDPTVNDDDTVGAQVGYTWRNSTSGAIFYCTDNSTGAAVWVQIYPQAQGVSMPVLSKSAAYSVAAGDIGHLIDCTTGTFTVTLLAAATAGDGFLIGVRNSGTGVITVTDGTFSKTVPSGCSILITCDGAAYFMVAAYGYELGENQTWQNVSASRAIATTYTNTTGRTIAVSVSVTDNTTGNVYLNGYINGTIMMYSNGRSSGSANLHLYMEVPNGATYSFTLSAGTAASTTWWELR